MPRQVAQAGSLIARASPPRAVGMPVDVRFTGLLPNGAELVDHRPRPRDTLPGGVRVLSSDSLQVDHGAVAGHLRLVFFRPDSQSVPSFVVAYRAGERADTLVSAPIRLFVRSVLPVGNATLRDIRDVDAPWLTPRTVAATATIIGLALAVVVIARRVNVRRHQIAAAAQAAAVAATPPSAYAVALTALDAIEARGWLASGAVDRHYALVADVVRRYLEDAHAIPALERTTPEVLGALPPALAGNGDGAGAALRALLGEADLVKFARLRPADRTASAFAARARAVLAHWEHAADAIR